MLAGILLIAAIAVALASCQLATVSLLETRQLIAESTALSDGVAFQHSSETKKYDSKHIQ